MQFCFPRFIPMVMVDTNHWKRKADYMTMDYQTSVHI
jgi:hypothetical protein